MFGTELLSPCELLCFYFMWHPNEKKLFYFIRKFFHLTFLMVRLYRSMSYISFILLGKFFIWIFMHFVWYYGIKDNLVVILNLYLENLMHYFFSVLSILSAHSVQTSKNLAIWLKIYVCLFGQENWIRKTNSNRYNSWFLIQIRSMWILKRYLWPFPRPEAIFKPSAVPDY